MGSKEDESVSGPVVFALQWLGIAVVMVLIVAVVAGLLRDDMAGTIGPVVMWGMVMSACAIVFALFKREHRA